MLRSDPVREVDRLLEAPGNDDCTVAFPRLPGNALPGEFLKLLFDLSGYLLAELPVSGNQDGRGQLIMLGLRKEIGRDMRRSPAAVVDHQDLGRSGDHVDADLPEDQLLRGRDIDVPRAGDLVDLGNCSSTVG